MGLYLKYFSVIHVDFLRDNHKKEEIKLIYTNSCFKQDFNACFSSILHESISFP